MADGLFYLDQRSPFITADVGAVTLSSTDKALYPAASFPVLGANYFGWPGKALKVTLFGRITTAVTPGNGAFDVYWGSGADANGTIIGTGTAVALTASQTSLSWWAEFIIRCRATGTSGSLFCTGHAHFNEAVLAAEQLIPANLAAAVTVDLTVAASIVSVQYKRSGSTAETMQVHELLVEALN